MIGVPLCRLPRRAPPRASIGRPLLFDVDAFRLHLGMEAHRAVASARSRVFANKLSTREVAVNTSRLFRNAMVVEVAVNVAADVDATLPPRSAVEFHLIVPFWAEARRDGLQLVKGLL